MSDLISRQVAIKAIDDLPNCYNGYSDTYDKAYIIGALEELPTVDAVPVRHGHWIKEFENEDGRNLRCSECRMVFYVGKGRDGNYCPNCGSRMDGE